MSLDQNVREDLAGNVFIRVQSGDDATAIGHVGDALKVYNANSSMTPAATGSSLTPITVTGVSQLAIAANDDRRGYRLFNQCDGFVYVSEASSAATGSFSLIMQPNGFYNVNGALGECYSGDLAIISGGGVSGIVHVTEITI